MVLQSGQSNFGFRTIDGFFGVVLAGTAVYLSGPLAVTPMLLRGKPGEVQTYLVASLLFTLLWNKCVDLTGLNERFVHTVGRMLVRSARVAAVMTTALASILALVPIAEHRGFAIALFFGFAFLYKAFSFFIKAKLSAHRETAIILGTGRRAQKAWREFRIGQYRSATFAGFVGDCDRSTLGPDIRKHCVTRMVDLSAFLLENPVDIMIVATSLRTDFDVTRNAIAVAEMYDVKVFCLEDRFELGHAPGEHEHVFTELAADNEAQQFRSKMKYTVDKVVAGISLALFAPVLTLPLALASLFVNGPLIIREPRYGYHRRRFQMLSFNPSLKVPWLEMLPRLWNVVTGDMSLIGPEPMTTIGLSPTQDPEWANMFREKPGVFRPTHRLKSRSRGIPRTATLIYR
jgi:hypothetical protein